MKYCCRADVAQAFAFFCPSQATQDWLFARGMADCHQSFPERLRSLTTTKLFHHTNLRAATRSRMTYLISVTCIRNPDAVAFSFVTPVIPIPISICSISFLQCLEVEKVDQTSRFEITLGSNVELISS
jgi:hypothetical protein